MLVDYKIDFDEVMSPKGIKSLLREFTRKHDVNILEIQKTTLPTTLSDFNLTLRRPTSREIAKPLDSHTTYSKLADASLIFPKLEHLDMSENMINSEEAILTTIVCPNLKTTRIFGNPLVDQYSDAPPKILAILVKTLGISVECERSDTWGLSSAKLDSAISTPTRKNQLISLNLHTKNNEKYVKGELKSNSEENTKFNRCPFLPQLEMRTDYTDLSKDVHSLGKITKEADVIITALSEHLPKASKKRRYTKGCSVMNKYEISPLVELNKLPGEVKLFPT
ncbi:unnamed protein product [Hymenolepis diminuta]|uniref:LRRcap domain-containing protein n=2 Tax=Hymenolepis diminuta TaxID=6216 RepID=A0A158QD64_HYMDI|nr:unnamed protein product [Hymenolepis diminuta]